MLNRLFNTLFGKLFAGFCLVILLTAAGVWMAAYSAQSQQNEDIGRIEWRFIAHKSVDSAVGIYVGGWQGRPHLMAAQRAPQHQSHRLRA